MNYLRVAPSPPRETLIQAVDTCLSSKVVSQNCETISPMAVDAVLGIIDPINATNVDLRDIKVIYSGGRKTSGGLGVGRQTKLLGGACSAQRGV